MIYLFQVFLPTVNSWSSMRPRTKLELSLSDAIGYKEMRLGTELVRVIDSSDPNNPIFNDGQIRIMIRDRKINEIL